jgi:hypothetical protein
VADPQRQAAAGTGRGDRAAGAEYLPDKKQETPPSLILSENGHARRGRLALALGALLPLLVSCGLFGPANIVCRPSGTATM